MKRGFVIRWQQRGSTPGHVWLAWELLGAVKVPLERARIYPSAAAAEQLVREIGHQLGRDRLAGIYSYGAALDAMAAESQAVEQAACCPVSGISGRVA